MFASSAQLSQLEKSLVDALDGDVFFDPYRRSLYSTDASIYSIQPLAVALPKTRAAVVRALQWAAEHRIPVIPRGSGTSLSGQSIGPGLILDQSKYRHRILDIDPVAQTALVEPGVVLDQLNFAAAEHGLQFGPDVATSSRANLGGMLGNNSAGSRSILQGKTVDHVIALDAVLADGSEARFGPVTPAEFQQLASQANTLGRVARTLQEIVDRERAEIIARFPPLVRRVSGYNLDEFVPECQSRLHPPPLAQLVRMREADRHPGAAWNLARLLVGAEGTLAAIAEAQLHLVPLPARRGLVVLEFDSLAAAIGAVGVMLSCHPSAVELFDGLILQLAAKSLEYSHYLDFVSGRPESLILVEFSGDTDAEIQLRINELLDKLKFCPGLTHRQATQDRELAAHIWACRKAALPLLMGIPGQRKPIAFVEDTAVAPERLPEFVARFREILTRAGTDGAFYGHASVGVLHIRPLIDTRSCEDLVRFEQILADVSDLVAEFGGAMSGEHGDGLARSFLNAKLFGPRIYQAFREIKAAFDPDGRMNPGKIVDGPSPIEHLRHPPEEPQLHWPTIFDYSRQGGAIAAAALCNGSGLCRKTQHGTMCPSYMATGDEEHSTRGRANALRMVLTGKLPPQQLTSPQLHSTFDLCLQCKGCKAECPSNVDVGKLKADFLHTYYQVHGTPLSARFIGHVARWNHLASSFAPLSNWLAAAPGSAWLREKLLGIDRRRPLPSFARDHFARWFQRHRPPASAPRGPIVLLDDCLTSFCEPAVNRSAVELLEAAGYEVHLARLSCCGRALISKGLLAEAQQLARANLAQLKPWLDRGAFIVGTEPSCLLTLADDYRDLVPGPLAEQLAAQSRLVDTHLVREQIPLPLQARPDPLLLHGHCHQKALLGLADTLALLRAVPETTVSVVDSGCCGMAGSFGYEHYELSLQIGQRVLFPAVQQHAGAVVAPGFSCRHQIEHGTGRSAQHPLQYVAQALQMPKT
jgi:FAD/FMN-containing dehydrogenase/Fe-S oxidoreductase